MSKNRNEFQILLVDLINKSLKNYHIDNHDERRFGADTENIFSKKINQLKQKLFRNHLNIGFVKTLNSSTSQIMVQYGSQLDQVFNLLEDEESRQLYVYLVAYYLLGKTKVKLPSNNEQYIENRIIDKSIWDTSKSIDASWLNEQRKLFFADLSKIGFDLRIYGLNIEHLFLNKQYEYQSIVKVEKGDYVLDCGVCYGDTALYFSEQTGEKGKVFGVEFIPSNLNITNQNLELNPVIRQNISIIKKPLWNQVEKLVYFTDKGPASQVKFVPFDDMDGETTTTTIDEIVKTKKIRKIDFIKMDIEGAEPYALEGAINTIKKHKPKLAIAIYHSMSDFVNIPLWIDDLNLGYKFYIKHPTINWEETILFAEPVKK